MVFAEHYFSDFVRHFQDLNRVQIQFHLASYTRTRVHSYTVPRTWVHSYTIPRTWVHSYTTFPRAWNYDNSHYSLIMMHYLL